MRRKLGKVIRPLALSGLLIGGATPPAAAGGWGYSHGHGGWDDGAGVAAGVLGGLALGTVIGAAAAQQPHYVGGYPAYGDCYRIDQRVTDDWGDVVDYRHVHVCD